MIRVDGRAHGTREEPVVGVCLDGCAPEYLEAAEGFELPDDRIGDLVVRTWPRNPPSWPRTRRFFA